MKFVISMLALFALLSGLVLGLLSLPQVIQNRIFAGLLIAVIGLISFAFGRTSQGNIAAMTVVPTISGLAFMTELYHVDLGLLVSDDFSILLSFSVGFISFVGFLYGDLKPTLLPTGKDNAPDDG